MKPEIPNTDAELGVDFSPHTNLKPKPPIAASRPDPSAPAKRGLVCLMAMHYKMIDMYLEGMSQTDIGKYFGFTPGAINNVIKSGVAQHEIARRRKAIEAGVTENIRSTTDAAREAIEAAALSAAEHMIGAMDEGGSVGLQAATKILDRAAPMKVDEGPVSMKIDSATIINLQQVIAETTEIRKGKELEVDDVTITKMV